MGKRKKYTEEFKREAVQLMMTRDERTISLAYALVLRRLHCAGILLGRSGLSGAAR